MFLKFPNSREIPERVGLQSTDTNATTRESHNMDCTR